MSVVGVQAHQYKEAFCGQMQDMLQHTTVLPIDAINILGVQLELRDPEPIVASAAGYLNHTACATVKMTAAGTDDAGQRMSVSESKTWFDHRVVAVNGEQGDAGMNPTQWVATEFGRAAFGPLELAHTTKIEKGGLLTLNRKKYTIPGM